MKKWQKLTLGSLALGFLLLGGLAMAFLQGGWLRLGRIDKSLLRAWPHVYHYRLLDIESHESEDGCLKVVKLAPDERLFSFRIKMLETADFCNSERCETLEHLGRYLKKELEVNGIAKDKIPQVPVCIEYLTSVPYAHFIKVLDVCASAGLKNFALFGGMKSETWSRSGPEVSCPLPHGFPVDLSARYVNRVLVEVDANNAVKVDGIPVEGEEALRGTFARVQRQACRRFGGDHVHMVFKAAPMATMKAVRDCINAASAELIVYYYMVGQSAENGWTAVGLDIPRPNCVCWGDPPQRLEKQGQPK